MNRQIKFRAWDKKEQIICPVRLISFEKGAFLIGNSPTPMQWIDDRSYIDEIKEGHFVHFDDLILMQYTGLNDTNGVEIYEGDILSLDGGGEQGHTMTVDFADGCFVVQPDWLTEESIKKYKLPTLKSYVGLSFCSVEVIGNIYQQRKQKAS